MLVDGHGKKNLQLSGLTDTMKRAVFSPTLNLQIKVGDMCLVEVKDASNNALHCEPLGHMDVKTYFETFGKNRRNT